MAASVRSSLLPKTRLFNSHTSANAFRGLLIEAPEIIADFGPCIQVFPDIPKAPLSTFQVFDFVPGINVVNDVLHVMDELRRSIVWGLPIRFQ